VPATATATPTPTSTPSPEPATSSTVQSDAAASPTAGQQPVATSTATPRPTAEPTAIAVAAAQEGTYKVRAGDTLSAIAARLGVTAEALIVANDIDDPTLLRVGQVLQIPTPGEVAVPQATATPQPPPTSTPPPTEVPTVAMRFAAPVLVNPAENTPYSGGEETRIELTWESVGTLAEDEEYVVYVGVVRGDGETDWIQTEPQHQALQGLSWRVEAWMHALGDQGSGRTFVWYVQVEQVLRDGSGEVVRDESGGARRQPISPRSEMRRFSWQ
jgi:LysM repeat protein